MVMMHNYLLFRYFCKYCIIMVEVMNIQSPFQPFTGYTSKIKPNNEFIAKNEGGDDSKNSQKSPRFLTKEI